MTKKQTLSASHGSTSIRSSYRAADKTTSGKTLHTAANMRVRYGLRSRTTTQDRSLRNRSRSRVRLRWRQMQRRLRLGWDQGEDRCQMSHRARHRRIPRRKTQRRERRTFRCSRRCRVWNIMRHRCRLPDYQNTPSTDSNHMIRSTHQSRSTSPRLMVHASPDATPHRTTTATHPSNTLQTPRPMQQSCPQWATRTTTDRLHLLSTEAAAPSRAQARYPIRDRVTSWVPRKRRRR
jgi:hypothetical protein